MVRPAQEVVAHMLLLLDHERRDHECPALAEVVARVGEVVGLAEGVGPDLQPAARVPRHLGQGHLDEGRHPEPPRRAGAVADGEQAHLERLVRRHEQDELELQPLALHGVGGVARPEHGLVDRIGMALRRQPGTVDAAGIEVHHVDGAGGQLRRDRVEVAGREAVLLGVAGEGVDLAVVLSHGTMAQRVGQDMMPGPWRGAGDDQLLAIGREAVGQGGIPGRPQAAVQLAHAVEQRGHRSGCGRRPLQVASDQGGGRGLVAGIAVDQAQLGRPARRDLDAQAQAGDGVEGVEQALLGGVAHPAFGRTLGVRERACADEAGPGVLVAGQGHGRAVGAGRRHGTRPRARTGSRRRAPGAA